MIQKDSYGFSDFTLKIDFGSHILALFDSYVWPFNKSEKMCSRNLLMSPYDPLSMAPKLPIDARLPEDQSGHSVRIMLKVFTPNWHEL